MPDTEPAMVAVASVPVPEPPESEIRTPGGDEYPVPGAVTAGLIGTPFCTTGVPVACTPPAPGALNVTVVPLRGYPVPVALLGSVAPPILLRKAPPASTEKTSQPTLR